MEIEKLCADRWKMDNNQLRIMKIFINIVFWLMLTFIWYHLSSLRDDAETAKKYSTILSEIKSCDNDGLCGGKVTESQMFEIDTLLRQKRIKCDNASISYLIVNMGLGVIIIASYLSYRKSVQEFKNNEFKRFRMRLSESEHPSWKNNDHVKVQPVNHGS
jgi:hypothetical protein